MANKYRDFDDNTYDSDWGEYKKNTKKKTKHRDREESKPWKFDSKLDYKTEDAHDYFEDSKTGDW
jgi:hypothetical protein